MFTIYPAIDIRGGRCVRLMKGDYDQETVYGDSPPDMAEAFYQEGAGWIHIVDLDGAKKGEPVNRDAILQIKKQVNVKVQVGGGLRKKEDIGRYLDAGVDRVIIGSSAVSDPDFVKKMLHTYRHRIVIGIDVRNGYVAVEGWTKTSKVKAEDLVVELVAAGAGVFIFTDISKDGTLAGPNVEAMKQLVRVTGKEVIASGGMGRLSDVKKIKDAGVSGVIIGRALYAKAFTLGDALKEVQSC